MGCAWTVLGRCSARPDCRQTASPRQSGSATWATSAESSRDGSDLRPGSSAASVRPRRTKGRGHGGLTTEGATGRLPPAAQPEVTGTTGGLHDFSAWAGRNQTRDSPLGEAARCPRRPKPSLRITRIDGSFSGSASAAISVKFRTSKPLRRHTQHDLDRIPERRGLAEAGSPVLGEHEEETRCGTRRSAGRFPRGRSVVRRCHPTDRSRPIDRCRPLV
jgi:hypothetical protein